MRPNGRKEIGELTPAARRTRAVARILTSCQAPRREKSGGKVAPPSERAPSQGGLKVSRRIDGGNGGSKERKMRKPNWNVEALQRQWVA